MLDGRRTIAALAHATRVPMRKASPTRHVMSAETAPPLLWTAQLVPRPSTHSRRARRRQTAFSNRKEAAAGFPCSWGSRAPRRRTMAAAFRSPIAKASAARARASAARKTAGRRAVNSAEALCRSTACEGAARVTCSPTPGLETDRSAVAGVSVGRCVARRSGHAAGDSCAVYTRHGAAVDAEALIRPALVGASVSVSAVALARALLLLVAAELPTRRGRRKAGSLRTAPGVAHGNVCPRVAGRCITHRRRVAGFGRHVRNVRHRGEDVEVLRTSDHEQHEVAEDRSLHVVQECDRHGPAGQ